MHKITSITAFILLVVYGDAYGASGDITFTPPNQDPVSFSHDLHTKYRGVKCMACHFDKFASGKSGFKINKDTLNKRDFCRHCHNGLKAFDQQNAKNCNRCRHKDEGGRT
jgi:c(7)-type cytochrome triheme protein